MIMKQLLSSLVYLHNNNISHRDIKPENFILAKPDDPSCVKMIDFGLSKDFSGQPFMKTMSGSVSGLPPHLFIIDICCPLFSPTTSHQKYSCRTTTPRSTFGPWEWFCTSCSRARCHSQATQSWRSLEMSSRETSTLTTSLSRDTHQRRKSSCSAS